MFLQCKGLIFMGRCTFPTQKEIMKCIENRPSGSETESECQLPSWKKSFKSDYYLGAWQECCGVDNTYFRKSCRRQAFLMYMQQFALFLFLFVHVYWNLFFCCCGGSCGGPLVDQKWLWKASLKELYRKVFLKACAKFSRKSHRISVFPLCMLLSFFASKWMRTWFPLMIDNAGVFPLRFLRSVDIFW